jgi:calcineurin-like phosphoesterase
MTGPYDSVLGRDKDAVISSLVTGVPQPYAVAKEDARLSGVIIETTDETGRATRIERVHLTDPQPMSPGDDD